jgi:hypothetical protein
MCNKVKVLLTWVSTLLLPSWATAFLSRYDAGSIALAHVDVASEVEELSRELTATPGAAGFFTHLTHGVDFGVCRPFHPRFDLLA